ncbi:HNH endonuclease [Polynucleobacter asymbioticus]|jgi:hypothetical protein|uniref:HNH domain-containing protein n=1 Tax=Polynucleobacter asymbioticus TaxID=576611 RepID=A0AAC9IY44_9BURK|nr:HNH endonuclease [Polynucleobacter asymbioticus]APB99005.1 hypothetical protein A4F89_06535 [Polynucleobacter asymbioticus]APC01307.1 hypothetical protein AOC25_06635 [Polynucleobacter asymbioticus]
MTIIKRIKDAVNGKAPLSAKRSGKWPSVRKHFLAINPACAVCGGFKKIEVHHKNPFHLHPELELDSSNLITLCEEDTNGVNCHLLFGHLGNFKSLNKTVVKDAATWNKKIQTRPIISKESI